jgi:hypothetical protein
MRRLIIYLSVAALSFFVGLSALKLWRVSPSPPSIDIPLTVSFCDLESEPERYNGKFIRVKGELIRDTMPFIYDWSCNQPNINTLPPIYLDDLDKVNVRVLSRLAVEAGQPFSISEELTAIGIFEVDYKASDAPRLRIVLKTAVLIE